MTCCRMTATGACGAPLTTPCRHGMPVNGWSGCCASPRTTIAKATLIDDLEPLIAAGGHTHACANCKPAICRHNQVMTSPVEQHALADYDRLFIVPADRDSGGGSSWLSTLSCC